MPKKSVLSGPWYSVVGSVGVVASATVGVVAGEVVVGAVAAPSETVEPARSGPTDA